MNTLTSNRPPIEQTASRAWVMLASTYQARLLRCDAVSIKRCRIEELDRIEAPLPAAGYERVHAIPGTSDQRYKARYKILEEEAQRFARQLRRWMKRIVQDEEIEQLTIFAPARLFEVLQRSPLEVGPAKIDLRAGNLMNTFDDQLRCHPAIMGLLRPKGEGRQVATRSADLLNHQRAAYQ